MKHGLRVQLVLAAVAAALFYFSCTNAPGGTRGTVEPLYGDTYVQTLLVFGLSKPDGGTVTEEQWQNFVDTYVTVTPVFSEGLSIINSNGQWMMQLGELIKEDSRIIILLYDDESSAEVDEDIERIKETYKRLFNQEAVLRITSLVGVSF